MAKRSEVEPLSGFRVPQPKVFAGVYPVSGEHFHRLRQAIDKLRLNDASITVRQHSSVALGQGFQCGFLGLLHLDIVRERLLREYEVELIMTAPNVMYKIKSTDGSDTQVSTPSDFPDAAHIAVIKEQYAKVEVITPIKFLGNVFELMKDSEGVFLRQENVGESRVMVEYELPLRELVIDLYDRLKSVTSGYGSLSYDLSDWRDADVVRLNILVNHELVEALCVVVPRKEAESVGRKMVKKLREKMPRQMFAVPLQAAVGGTIVARETLPALRKDVTGYLYGGDVTRKKKLLEKQKKGKKKMAESGKINIPPDVYRGVLKNS
jgi:GTP-binding protein LepA